MHTKRIVIQIFALIIMSETFDQVFDLIGDSIFSFANYESPELNDIKTALLEKMNQKEVCINRKPLVIAMLKKKFFR